jgi:2-haloacid dehalogenase
MLDFASFRVLTFDCYGTLIDWESGILAALRPILQAHGVAPGGEEILELYARLESEAETGGYRSYRDVLRRVVAGVGAAWGFRPTPAESRSLEDSLPGWEPFPDTVDALQRLHRRYALAIVSNTDDELFAATAARLGIRFDAVVTAQQARAYKPRLEIFQRALERIQQPASRILHVAQSLHHDIPPARRLGISTVHVDRRRGRAGGGATLPAAVPPDLTVPDLHALAAMMGL